MNLLSNAKKTRVRKDKPKIPAAELLNIYQNIESMSPADLYKAELSKKQAPIKRLKIADTVVRGRIPREFNSQLGATQAKFHKLRTYDDILQKAIADSYMHSVLGNHQAAMAGLAESYSPQIARMMLDSRLLNSTVETPYDSYSSIKPYIADNVNIVLYAPLNPNIALYINELVQKRTISNIKLRIITPLLSEITFYREQLNFNVGYIQGTLDSPGARSLLRNPEANLTILGLQNNPVPNIDILYAWVLNANVERLGHRMIVFTGTKFTDTFNSKKLIQSLDQHQFNRVMCMLKRRQVTYEESNAIYNRALSPEVYGGTLVEASNIYGSKNGVTVQIPVIRASDGLSASYDILEYTALNNPVKPIVQWRSGSYSVIVKQLFYTGYKTLASDPNNYLLLAERDGSWIPDPYIVNDADPLHLIISNIRTPDNKIELDEQNLTYAGTSYYITSPQFELDTPFTYDGVTYTFNANPVDDEATQGIRVDRPEDIPDEVEQVEGAQSNRTPLSMSPLAGIAEASRTQVYNPRINLNNRLPGDETDPEPDQGIPAEIQGDPDDVELEHIKPFTVIPLDPVLDSNGRIRMYATVFD